MRIEQLARSANELHDDFMRSMDQAESVSAAVLAEFGQFNGARLILEDIACHEPPAAPADPPPRIVLP
jgi:hypothetical protein